MNTANHISDEDLALFALQVLPEQEVGDAHTHLEHCDDCRRQIGRYQGDLAAYALTSELHSPPAMARERLMRRVAKEKKVQPLERVQRVDQSLAQPLADTEPLLAGRTSRVFEMEPRDTVTRSRAAIILAAAGWALAASLAVAVGLQFHDRQNLRSSLNAETAQLSAAKASSAQDAQATGVFQTLTAPDAIQAALHSTAPIAAGAAKPASGPAPQAHVNYDADSGSLLLVAGNLQPLPPYKTYELWILPSQPGADPVPAGIFKPDASGYASVVLPPLPKGVGAKGFAVTVEDDGGSKQPTMPIVLGM